MSRVLRYISVDNQVRQDIQNEVGCVYNHVYKALRYKGEGEKTTKIRELALARGGEIRIDAPECETIHDAGGRMIQRMPNGAQVICDKQTGDVRVEHQGVLIASYPNARISTLLTAQTLANSL